MDTLTQDMDSMCIHIYTYVNVYTKHTNLLNMSIYLHFINLIIRCIFNLQLIHYKYMEPSK